MNKRSARLIQGALGVCALAILTAATVERTEVPNGAPAATVNLATDVGVRMVKGAITRAAASMSAGPIGRAGSVMRN